MGGLVGLSILWSQDKKAGLTSIPYLGKYSINSMKETISQAYKQFW